MKKTIYLILLVISVFGFAQQGPNPFSEPESQNAFSRDNSVKDERPKGGQVQSLDGGGGNPGDPVPNDNYIPFLLLTAVGLIIYQVRKQKQLN